MPPKRKKGKKKKRKRSKKSLEDEMGKDYFLYQIQVLDEKFRDKENRFNELNEQHTQLENDFQKDTTDKKDIINYLERTVEQRTAELEDLNRLLSALQLEFAEAREDFGTRFDAEKRRFDEMKEELTAKIIVLSQKLDALEDFRLNKERLMAEFARLEKELANHKAYHQQTVYELEKRSIMDKMRLREQMVIEIYKLAAEFRVVTFQHLSETIKRAILENIGLHKQLNFVSEAAEDLLGQTDELKEKQKEHLNLVDILETNEQSLTTKNMSHAKVISILVQKNKDQKNDIGALMRKDTEFNTLFSENYTLKSELSVAKSELEAMEECIIRGRMKELAEALQKAMKERDDIEKILLSAAHTVRDAVMNEERRHDSEASSAMLEGVFRILNDAACACMGSNGPTAPRLSSQPNQPVVSSYSFTPEVSNTPNYEGDIDTSSSEKFAKEITGSKNALPQKRDGSDTKQRVSFITVQRRPTEKEKHNFPSVAVVKELNTGSKLEIMQSLAKKT